MQFVNATYTDWLYGKLNINSVRNKFGSLVQQVTGNFDILMLSETKLGNSFPMSQFLIYGYTPPFRIDPHNNEGGVMLFVRDDIPCKLLPVEIQLSHGWILCRS